MTSRPIISAPVAEDKRCSNGKTLPQLVQSNAVEFADMAAVKSKRSGIWRKKSWPMLFDEMRLAARGLAACDLKRGDVLAFISENIEEQLIVQLAALSLGAITVSVYPDATIDELEYIIVHSGAVMIMGEDQEQVDKILQCKSGVPEIRRILYVDDRGLWEYSDPRLISLEDALKMAGDYESPAWIDAEIAKGLQEHVAVYCYTSGTTGKPKAAMLSHAFILDNAYRLMGALDVRQGSNYLSYISPAWAAEQFFGIALPLLAPMVVHFAEKPETIQHDLREVGPEFLMFTPRQWEMQASDVEARMMDAPAFQRCLYRWGIQQGLEKVRGKSGLLFRYVSWPLAEMLVLRGIRNLLGLTCARAVLSGGSGLSTELFERFRSFGVPLGNLYGSTELGLISTHRPGSKTPETMGTFMPSDPTITGPIEGWVDEQGQLCLKTLAFSGFLNDPEATVELGHSESGYKTGDAVRVNEDGELIYLDRLKDLRKLRTGQAYPPQFIENHLRASSLIRDAIVIGDENRDNVVSLINIDAEIAGRFAEINGLAYGTFPELSQLPLIREEVGRVLAKVNGLVDKDARVISFINLPKELDADESELTRSRKLRREHIHARYATMIDALYSGDDSLTTEIEVKYQDGSTSLLKAVVAINRIEDSL
ncbi:long-chain fatty acid--CoA ligase [Sneathiella sp.]|uniref:AMP-dependent synthetase/ligase n=1 Tax=Sneathiella sp. TaxID=1964365 RepID=UPI003567649B